MKFRRSSPIHGSFRGVAVFICIVAVLLIGAFSFRLLYPATGTAELEIRFLDVGQGDSALILHADGTVMIDTGESENGPYLGNILDMCGGKLSCLVLTHPHSDHMGGAAYILEHYDVDTVILPTGPGGDGGYTALLALIRDKGIATATLAPGEAFRLGDLRFTCLAPLTDHDWENDNSYVLRMDYGEISALFTGDAESASEATQLAVYGAAPGGFLDVDLLKVGHHGSATSSTDLYLAAVTPKYAVISCGADNAYGHPHKEVLSRLMQAGARILRTDLSGTVVFRTDGNTLELIP